MKFGIDRLVAEPQLRAPLKGRRVALLAHPASVTRDLTHSLDALGTCGDVKLTAAFGPQHGLRGDKQDNMVESPDFTDPVHGIPVFSLYGRVRRPTAGSAIIADPAAPLTCIKTSSACRPRPYRPERRRRRWRRIVCWSGSPGRNPSGPRDAPGAPL